MNVLKELLAWFILIIMIIGLYQIILFLVRTTNNLLEKISNRTNKKDKYKTYNTKIQNTQTNNQQTSNYQSTNNQSNSYQSTYNQTSYNQASYSQTSFRQTYNAQNTEGYKTNTQKTTDNYNQSHYSRSYQSKNLLTRNEWYEYRKLKKLAEKKELQVCPKVRLLDIIEPRHGKNYMSLLGKIQNKHVDFVICDQDLRIKGILELDDNSHDNPIRQERDQFVDEILTSVGYKVIHTRGITENTLDPITQPKPTEENKEAPKA